MPKEINRILPDHISDLLFCPTETAVLNLKNEGVTTGVYNVGDVMFHALEYNLKIAGVVVTVPGDLGINPKEYLVATVHRVSKPLIPIASRTFHLLLMPSVGLIFLLFLQYTQELKNT